MPQDIDVDYPEVPNQVKRSTRLKKSFPTIGISGICIIVMYFVLTSLILPQGRYAISVDPILVKDNLDTETHVEIKNIGTEPLTNIKVTYGGTTKPDLIAILNPGQKIALSPPDGSDIEQVTVVTEQGIKITKQYRVPASALFDHM